MRALQLCNGKIDFSLPLISQEIRDMLPVIERNGVISRCEKGDAILPDQEYKLYSARYSRFDHFLGSVRSAK